MRLTRLIPHFSLRSLLLAVLALGACGALWMNWGPWRIEREFRDGAPRYARGLYLSPDGCWVVAEYSVADGDPDIRRRFVVWDATSGERSEFRIDGMVAYFSSNSAFLIAGFAYSNEVVLWELNTRSERRIRDFPINTSTFPYFSPDGSRLFSLRKGLNVLQIVDVRTLETVARIEDVLDIYVPFAGNKACYRHADGSLRFVEVNSGAELQKISAHPDWDFKTAHLLNDGVVIQASWSEHEWEDHVLLVKGNDVENAHVIRGELRTISKNGTRVLSEDVDRRSYQVTEFPSRKELFRFPKVYDYLSFTDDGKYLICSPDLSVYDSATGRVLHRLDNAAGSEFSKEKKWVLRDETPSGGEFYIYDLMKGRRIQTLFKHGSGTDYSLSFSDDGKRFVSQHRDTKVVFLWRLQRPEPWWGAAWLVEFWVSFGMVVLLGWSVMSERRKAQ